MLNASSFFAPAALGIAVAGVMALPTAAIAANITRVPGNFAYLTPSSPDGWENLNWATRGRASAPGDWEFGVTTDDNINGAVQQADWNWVNGQAVPWDLLWNAAENKLTFTIGGHVLVLDQDGTPPGIFNGFYLWTTSRTDSRVDAGTQMYLQVNTVNGHTVEGSLVNSTATAPVGGGQEISKFFFASDVAITTITGFARMSWPEGARNPQQSGARDRVAFKIEGFYTGITEEPPSVPEPASLLGLFAVGSLGVMGRKALKTNA